MKNEDLVFQTCAKHFHAPAFRSVNPKRKARKAHAISRPNGQRSPHRAILETCKTLVTAFGQTEAARQLKLPRNTVLAWAHRYGWKQSKAAACKTQSQVNTPSNALSKAISDHKTRSTLALGQYAAEAAESAANATDKLAIAKDEKMPILGNAKFFAPKGTKGKSNDKSDDSNGGGDEPW